MAVQSVQKNPHGPIWPLGMITVSAPGTPVGIMSLVDPNSYNDPASPTSAFSLEYTVRAWEIIFTACKPGAHGVAFNVGNVYILMKPVGSGAGNRDDYGSMLPPLGPAQTLILSSAALNFNVWSPYAFFVDADNAGDGALVTLIIQ